MEKLFNYLLSLVKNYTLKNVAAITKNVLDCFSEFLNSDIPPSEEFEKSKLLIKDFYENYKNKIENKIITPYILNPVLEKLTSFINSSEYAEEIGSENHQKLKEFTTKNFPTIKNKVKEIALSHTSQPILDEIELAISQKKISGKQSSKIPTILSSFMDKNLAKIKNKIKSITIDTALNPWCSIFIPDASVERFIALLDISNLNVTESALIFEPNEFQYLGFDLAKYYINELNFYNSKISTIMDPLIKSIFKGQIRINKFIIIKLEEYRKEKQFFKKYKEQLEKYKDQPEKLSGSNHKKNLNVILSSLKKMYNIIYVINQKITNNKRFSSKEAYIYYTNTYTPKKVKITDLKVKTWDNFIEVLKKTNNRTNDQIKTDLSTISTFLNMSFDPLTTTKNTINLITKILNRYLNIDSKTNLREVKKQSPYTSTEKGAKKFISKQKEKISSKITNYIKTFSNDYLLGDRILLCPYINNKYLDFKLAKDTISFLKEYNKASDKIMKNWIKYIDIPQQKSINKELISALEEYRSSKSALEKILQSKKPDYKKLIITKLKIKKDLNNIWKVCGKHSIKKCHWSKNNIKSTGNTAQKATNADEQFAAILEFMEASCKNNASLLWQNYLMKIGKTAKKTLNNLDNIINLNPSNNNIQIDYTNLKMKTIDYKILSKKELNKNDKISEDNFRKERYQSDIGKIEEKSKYSDTIDKLNLKYKKQSDSITLLNDQIESQKKFFNLQINKINIFSVKESENSKIMNHILSTFTNDHDKIKGKYQNLINLYRTNYKMSLLEKMLNLKNKIEIQKKYISKFKDLYKKINNHCKDATNTLLKIQSTITKSKNKYNSSYKIYNKYITKKALASNPEIIPNENNDIFVILTKEEINSDNQNIINDKMVKAKTALNDLLPDKEENANNLDKSSYLTLLSDYVNFIAEKIKKATT